MANYLKTFFLGSFLTEVRSSGLQACNVSEKEDFCKYFLGIFEILENFFFLSSSRKISVGEFLDRQ